MTDSSTMTKKRPDTSGGARQFSLPVEFIGRADVLPELTSLLEELVTNLNTYSRAGTAEKLRELLSLAGGHDRGSSGKQIQPEPEPVDAVSVLASELQAKHEQAQCVTPTRDAGSGSITIPARVLAADDNEQSRDLLAMTLEAEGHTVTTAADGLEAWEILGRETFDLVLLDIEMPRMSGLDVLKQMRQDPRLKHLPVIVISGMDEEDSVVTCIGMGAEDHLPKPFNHALLKARINASLEKKQLRDAERLHLDQIRHEQEISEALLLNVLPRQIATRLKQGESPIADQFPEATVLFADLVGFTQLSSKMPPAELVDMLNLIFTDFDYIAEKYGVEKIKTIGDAYMVVGGLPVPCEGHAVAVTNMAIDMQEVIARKAATSAPGLNIRIGINTGPVVAGVIGRNKFIYDLWGDAVNIASRMESHGEPGAIQVSESTAALLEGQFELEARGVIEIKGKGKMNTYLIRGATRQ
jgi:adenylate cyclase